jgi:hypothetical protein
VSAPIYMDRLLTRRGLPSRATFSAKPRPTVTRSEILL